MSGREVGIAYLCSLLFVVVMTFPLVFQAGGAMLSGKFQWSHAWLMEMVHQGFIGNRGISLSADGLFATTRLLNYPYGGSVVIVGWPVLLIGHLLRTLGFSFLAAFNCAFLLVLSLAPFFAYVLGRMLGLRRLGAAVAAAVFAASPYMLGILFNGQVAKACHGMIAGLACCAVGLGRGQLPWVLLLALLIPVTLSASPYYLLFSIPLCGVLFVRHQIQRRSVKNWIRGTLAGVLGTLAGGGACLPLVTHLSGRYDALLTPAGPETAELTGVIATPLSWVWPFELRTGGGPFIEGEHHVAYLGIGVLVVAALGVWTKRNVMAFLWLGVAVLYALISLGTAEQAGAPFPLPLEWVGPIAPESGMIMMAYRAIVVTTLAMGLLCGCGIQWLERRLPRPALVALIGLLLADLWLLPVAPFPAKSEEVRLPAVYREIAQEDGDFGIIEYPCDIYSPDMVEPDYEAALSKLNQQQIFYQAYHRKGLGMVDKGAFIKSLFKIPLLVSMGEIAFGFTSPFKESHDSRAYFDQNGFRYLILHEAYIHEEARAPLRAFLDTEFGVPERFRADQILRYQVSDVDFTKRVIHESPVVGRHRRTRGPPP